MTGGKPSFARRRESKPPSWRLRRLIQNSTGETLAVAVSPLGAYYRFSLRENETYGSQILREKEMASGSTYKVVELVGSSNANVQEAIDGRPSPGPRRPSATSTGSKCGKIRGTIDGDHANWYQVKLGIGFRVDSGDDVSQD